MTIEVRQLLINATVGMPGQGAHGEAHADNDAADDPLQQLRERLLAELKDWLEDQLRRSRER